MRTAALAQGPAALKALDDEVEALVREERWLTSVQSQAHSRREAALDAQAAREIPAAHKQFAAAMQRVRAAVQGLDTAIGTLNDLVGVLGNFDRLPDKTLPLNDSELAALLELRDEVWRTRVVRVLIPTVSVDDLDGAFDRWPRSLPLYFDIDEREITAGRAGHAPVIDRTLRRREPPCCANRRH